MARLTSIQHRRDTAANWTSVNPTLNSGEIGFETDTLKFKIGNGSTAWTSLAYQGGTGSGVTQIVAGTNVTISPTGGTGAVTINASGSGGGAAGDSDQTILPVQIFS